MSGTSTYLSGTLYDAAGRVTQRSLGNGLTQEYTYNSWTNQGGRLANLTTGTLQDLTYSYDANGNIESIVDALNGPQTQSFAYDTLNRLTSAAATGGQNGTYNETYTYSGTTGNLAGKAGNTYTYDINHPHAVASLSNGNSYTYDANGNQIERVVNNVTYTLSYDAENRLIGVSGTNLSASFTYDADGKRVQQVFDNVTTKFIGSHYEIDGTTVIKYYLAGATRVAMRTGTSAPKYFLQDHLGSTSLTTDASGNLVSQLWYKAWGEIRYSPGTTPTNYTYTGQYSNTSDFGLMYYGARWYDTSLGRFTQPDNLVPGAGNPQAYDRYSYANNNPSKYIDPTGHIACWDGNYDSSCNLQENNPYGFNKIEILPKITNDPPTIGAPPLPNNSDGRGNRDFELLSQFKLFSEKLISSAINFANYGKAINPVPQLDAALGVAGQLIYDLDNADLTLSQRAGRGLVAGIESMVTGYVSLYAGDLGAIAGEMVVPVGGGAIGYAISSISASVGLDFGFWPSANKSIFPYFNLGK